MIRIETVEIENFRSIISPALKIDDLGKYLVIVGPNNSGKSNILRALNLFFTGRVDDKPYLSATDFPKAKGLATTAATKITVTISFNSKKDLKVEKTLKTFEAEAGQQRLPASLLRLRLEINRKGRETWKFIGRAGIKGVRSELITPLVLALRGSVRFKYLPVGREISGIINKNLSEELIGTIFSGWTGLGKFRKQINKDIDSLIKKLQTRLQSTSGEITTTLASVFEEVKKAELKLPFKDLETLLPGLVPTIEDDYETGLNNKGAGIQTSVLLFFLKYLADNHPQHRYARVTYIWAVEEPESFLHPKKQKGMAKVLRGFSDDVQTLVTTHSPNFVPADADADANVLIVDKDLGKPHSTVVVGNKFGEARSRLGVTLLDSMYLSMYNLVVEGVSDEILLGEIWKKLFANGKVRIDPVEIRFLPSNGAVGAKDQFSSIFSFVDEEEREDTKVSVLFDGDKAGKRSMNGLIKSLAGQGYTVKSNVDYFVLSDEKDLEWYLSFEVMARLRAERPAQVTWVEDTDGDVVQFKFNEGHKKALAKRSVEMSGDTDLSDFEKLIKVIEKGWLD